MRQLRLRINHKKLTKKNKYFKLIKMQNKYEVLGVVGEGAYGIVYKCRNKGNNKRK